MTAAGADSTHHGHPVSHSTARQIMAITTYPNQSFPITRRSRELPGGAHRLGGTSASWGFLRAAINSAERRSRPDVPIRPAQAIVFVRAAVIIISGAVVAALLDSPDA